MSAPRRKPPRRPRRFLRGSLGFWCAVAIGLLMIAYIGVLEASRPHVSGDKLRLDGFFTLVQDGRIKEATVLDQDGYVVGDYQANDGTIRAYNLPYFKSEATREQLASTLVGNNVPTRVDQQFAKGLVGPATLLLPALILVVIFIYFIIAWRSGSGLFGVRSGAKRIAVEDANVGFADVAGQEEAVEELREVSDFLADPDRFASLGAQVPKGILLFGPPGCGKTLMARALAGEAGAAFYSISGADFVELYVGVGAARVRDLFKQARENAPAIIFIDEIDAVGRRRLGGGPSGGTGASSEEQNQALNALLAEIDGFSPTQGVIVIGATNRPDVLDPALLRPGRFDRAVGLALPNEEGRLEILQVHARSKALDPTVDLDAVARRAVGMTGADLASVMNEAALRAGREHQRQLSQQHLEEALNRVREAPERQRRLSLRDRRVGQSLLTDERVTFDDVAGADDAIEELREVREYLADPARFEELGAKIPNGYLIAGPPGAGKTLLARAVAGEANAAFVSASATEFVEVYVGEGAARVRDLFAQARATAPAIVFIDELDSIGSERGVAMTDHSERQQTLNQLLVELDGFGQQSGVIAIAATNRPDILDRALTRPGRFDRTIELDLPDREARLAILALHSRDKRLADDADLNSVAALTRGLSGAELAAIMNEAALLAGRRGRKDITAELLEESLERIGLGIGRSRRLSDEERRMIAYHEAGHGLVARALPGGRVLHKISIVASGRTGGTTWMSEDDDRMIHSRSLLIERMATFLGGRAAEQLVFGELGDGASSDLAVVGAIARRMVAQLGMSDALGAINYPVELNGRAPYSEETSRLIDEEARKLVAESEELADRVLRDSRDALDRVAKALLERETLTLEEVEEIAGPPPEVKSGASRVRR